MRKEKHIIDGTGIRISHSEKRVEVSQNGIKIRHEEKPVSLQMAESGLVYLLLDCSGSMAGTKLDQAKKGAFAFTKDAVAKGYRVGLIEFESSATHICDPTTDVVILQQRLNDIQLGGGTDMTSALLLAKNKLSNNRGLRVIVVVTDGMPNDTRSALKVAQEAVRSQVDIIAIGTDDADQDFLKKLASKKELGIKVTRTQFEEGITSAAKFLRLPGGD